MCRSPFLVIYTVGFLMPEVLQKASASQIAGKTGPKLKVQDVTSAVVSAQQMQEEGHLHTV